MFFIEFRGYQEFAGIESSVTTKVIVLIINHIKGYLLSQLIKRFDGRACFFPTKIRLKFSF